MLYRIIARMGYVMFIAFSKFASEKAEIRLMTVSEKKLPKSGQTSNGKSIPFAIQKKSNITSVLGMRKMRFKTCF
ncbi:hypothetical protein QUA62_01880 [Microcoleus sp. MON1_C1]